VIGCNTCIPQQPILERTLGGLWRPKTLSLGKIALQKYRTQQSLTADFCSEM